MFDVGFTELMLIGVVSLVVIGPERLPDVARQVGKWIGKMQRFVRGVKTDIANELDSGELKKLIGDQREQIEELRKVVGSTTRDLESSTRDVVRGARKKLNELEDAAARTDGEADADADVVRPSGPSTAPVPPAASPSSATPAEGSAAAAARTIGRPAQASAASRAAADPVPAKPSGPAASEPAVSGPVTTAPSDEAATSAPPTTDGAPDANASADDVAARRTGSDS